VSSLISDYLDPVDLYLGSYSSHNLKSNYQRKKVARELPVISKLDEHLIYKQTVLETCWLQIINKTSTAICYVYIDIDRFSIYKIIVFVALLTVY